VKEFKFELTMDEDFDGNGCCGRVVRINSHSLEEAFKKIENEKREGEWVYQVTVEVPGNECWQPIWDFLNGDLRR